MSIIDQLRHLGPSALAVGERGESSIPLFSEESGLILPPDYVDFLEGIGGPVVFDYGARFKPAEPSGREDDAGHRQLVVLYGCNQGQDSLIERYHWLVDQLPEGLVAIGETPGGDQLCVHGASHAVFLWKHDADLDEPVTKVSDTIADFLASLVPDPDDWGPSVRKIDESGSSLDF